LNLRKRIFTHLLLIHLLTALLPEQPDLLKHHVEPLTQQPGMKMILTSLLLVEFNIGLFPLRAVTQLKLVGQKVEMEITALVAQAQKLVEHLV
jgi:hypothetical protein